MTSYSKGRSILNRFALPAFSMALVLSSDSLVILGNAIGIAGISFLLFIVFTFFIYLVTLISYKEILSGSNSQGGEAAYMGGALGLVPAIALPLLSRVMFTVCAAAGLLATAGYVFNEVFVLWFPNLGFSFCALGILLVIGLLGNRFIYGVQAISIGAALLGILFLVFWGFFTSDGGAVEHSVVNIPFNPLSIGVMGLMIFMGVDLAVFAPACDCSHPSRLFRSMLLAIILAAVIIILWSLVSYSFVPRDRLMGSSIPYAIVARTISGETGRKIMGVVIIAGAFGAVNALLTCVSRMLASMGKHGFLPLFFSYSKQNPVVPLILLIIGIGAMLASGMAGEPLLGTMARSGIFFWLLTYSAIHLSVIINYVRKSRGPWSNPLPWSLLFPVIGFISMFSGAFFMLWYDPETVLFGKVILWALTVALIFSIIWVKVRPES